MFIIGFILIIIGLVYAILNQFIYRNWSKHAQTAILIGGIGILIIIYKSLFT